MNLKTQNKIVRLTGESDLNAALNNFDDRPAIIIAPVPLPRYLVQGFPIFLHAYAPLSKTRTSFKSEIKGDFHEWAIN